MTPQEHQAAAPAAVTGESNLPEPSSSTSHAVVDGRIEPSIQQPTRRRTTKPAAESRSSLHYRRGTEGNPTGATLDCCPDCFAQHRRHPSYVQQGLLYYTTARGGVREAGGQSNGRASLRRRASVKQQAASSTNAQVASFLRTLEQLRDLPSIPVQVICMKAAVPGVLTSRLEDFAKVGHWPIEIQTADKTREYQSTVHTSGICNVKNERVGNKPQDDVFLSSANPASHLACLEDIWRQEERLHQNRMEDIRYRPNIYANRPNVYANRPKQRRDMGFLDKCLIHPLDGNRLAILYSTIRGQHPYIILLRTRPCSRGIVPRTLGTTVLPPSAYYIRGGKSASAAFQVPELRLRPGRVVMKALINSTLVCNSAR
ncbi:unnamed protein product [Clonostachys solani]|uniref:Uncharacterized protein n=1 Tax=Clonostachys solani TaxID=160281 RepID=A0A9N9ZIR3_9HYPO|nr:unnamed protein product [Clonostachys solani]